MQLSLELDKTFKSCSRFDRSLVFEVSIAPKSDVFSNHFREPSTCCLGTTVSQIFGQNEGPKRLQNWFKSEVKNKFKT